jgi:FkbM family methyltransferase
MRDTLRGQRKIVRSLRKRYCETVEFLGFRRVLVRACGAYFLVDRTDQIQAAIAAHATWEPNSLNRLVRVARRHRFNHFVDIGANIGFYAIVLAKHQMADHILAIEPLPDNYRILLRHIALNRLHNVQAFAFALGDHNGKILITEGPYGNRSNGMIDPEDSGATAYEFKAESAVADPPHSRAQHLVDQARFDDRFSLRSQSILFKLDVECTELDALAGMSRTLRDNQCYLQVEAMEAHSEAIAHLLKEHGYSYAGNLGDDHYFTNIASLADPGRP